MGNDWILDVLADLKTYARQNGLSALAGQLDETILVAAAEVATSQDGAPLAAMGNAATSGAVHRAFGRGGNG